MNAHPCFKSTLCGDSRVNSVPNLNNSGPARWVHDSRTGEDYLIGHLLGRGGFAKCFLAYNNRQNFALKVISRRSLKSRSQIAKIRKEIYTHYSLRHSNIVALYNTFEDCENIYMLLEYCPMTLAQHIDSFSSQERFLLEHDAIVLMRQLLLAVRYLHNDCGLLHRDIKPGNILLSSQMTVKVADFGFCCSIREMEMRRHHTVCGTPNYVPAEVIDKKGHSVHSESWAVACTFFSMLFGYPPFHSSNLESTYSRIRRCDYSFPVRYPPLSKSAFDLIKRTLIREPKQRLTIGEMLAHSSLNPPNLNRSFIDGNNLQQLFLKKCFMSTIYNISEDCVSKNSPPPKQRPSAHDSGMGSDELSGGWVGRFMCQTLDKYINSMTMLMSPFSSLSIVPVLPASLPASSVCKWVDFTNKHGFGVTFHDGTRSLLFNDQSSLSTSYCQRYFTYRAQKFVGNFVEWNCDDGCPSDELLKKATIMRSYRGYMDRELRSSVPIQENSSSSLGTALPNSSQSHNQFNLLHIVDFHRFPDALILFTSDGTCQANFHDTRDKMLIYSGTAPQQIQADGVPVDSFQLHLITGGDQQIHSFQLVPNSCEFKVALPPLLSERRCARMCAFQRILQNYRHFLLSRTNCNFSTYC
ncbi:hypothetical protein niasHS_006855 [Heterodera schachtii]|uniref:Serine/threonine-protein kinase PLK n=1 Tax=Heterodera schachtii TaxID=97005 RepID=A0ABD2JIF9_HETSC